MLLLLKKGSCISPATSYTPTLLYCLCLSAGALKAEGGLLTCQATKEAKQKTLLFSGLGNRNVWKKMVGAKKRGGRELEGEDHFQHLPAGKVSAVVSPCIF